MVATPRVLVTVALGLAMAAASAPAASVLAIDPSPAPSATGAVGVADRGTHCVECYLFWDPSADARAVLDAPAVAEMPAWLGMDLATPDGSTIRLADFSGQPVVVELMATWCASCADQQDALRDARADLPADAVLVSLDVDPAGDPGALAAYAASHGYDWTFAHAPVALLRAIAETFGDDAVNPAASPVLVIGRDGATSMPPLGHKDRTAIAELLAGA